MTPYILVAFIFFAGSFTQSAAGFGGALVAMPLLTLIMGVETAAPTYSLLLVFTSASIAARFWKDIVWRDSLRLITTSILFVPVGAAALIALPPEPVTAVLGVLLILYAPYEILRSSRARETQPVIDPPSWAPYLAGAISGVLGGAYNTNGPPLIIYAVSRQWAKHAFKGTVQSVIFIQFVTIDIVHTYNGLVTMEVLRYCAAGAPGVVLGAWAGFAVDKYIPQVQFRRGVLVLVAILGISLIYRSLP